MQPQAGKIALAISLPVGAGLAALGWGIASANRAPQLTTASPAAHAPTTAPTPTATTSTATVTATVTQAVAQPAPSPTPAQPAPRTPQGTVVLSDAHNLGGDLRCTDVQIIYDNRSDTAVNTITQAFVMTYTPKHPA